MGKVNTRGGMWLTGAISLCAHPNILPLILPQNDVATIWIQTPAPVLDRDEWPQKQSKRSKPAMCSGARQRESYTIYELEEL